MLLSELFEIRNGLSSNNVELSEKADEFFSVPYIRPTSRYDSLIAGYCDPSYIDEKHVYGAESLMVSTDGEGSHSYSYVIPYKFIPNSNVSVLIPKVSMTLEEKLYYSMCITANRYKFCYGRKPKGDKLGNIILPSKKEIPKRVYKNQEETYDNICDSINKEKTKLNTNEWKMFKYDEIFEIKKGERLTSSDQIEGKIPYVSSSEFNNGIDNYIDNGYTDENCLSFACYGSIGNVFYHGGQVWISDNCNVFYIKGQKLNVYIGIFLATILELEKYRFSYGMTAKSKRLKSFNIKLPVDKAGLPDRIFMENYIKSLTYSASL